MDLVEQTVLYKPAQAVLQDNVVSNLTEFSATSPENRDRQKADFVTTVFRERFI